MAKMMRNIKLKYLLIVLFTGVIFTLVLFYFKAPGDSKPSNLLTDDQAILLVKKLPEVEAYIKDTKEATESGVYYSAGIVDINSDRTNQSFVTVHVYRYTEPLDQSPGMSQSFNYYTFDRETGRLKCEFAVFDEKGNFIRVTNNYPCSPLVGKSANPIKQKTEEIDYIQTYIPKDGKSGSCWTISNVSANDKAWRCITGNSIHDPCFEMDTNKLVCDVDPEVTRSGFVLNLTEVLPSRGIKTNQERFYWKIKLANDNKCWVTPGTAAMINGEYYYYACDKDNAVIVGELDKSTNLWSVNVAYLNETREEVIRTEKTEILKVWK